MAEAASAPAGDRIFLLSPADSAGRRAGLLRSARSSSELARRLHQPEGAPLGEVFAFISSLYFRGKLAYARAFARPPDGAPGAYVITPSDGLRPPESRIGVADLARYAGIPLDLAEARYREPLQRDLASLRSSWPETDVVLLGSIASDKYVEILTRALGERVLFPSDFVGRGDMSRGGLMLRAAEAGRELAYSALQGAARRGPRPARLPPRGRGAPPAGSGHP